MGHWKEFAMDEDENRNNARLASILGITPDELAQLDYTIEADTGKDDMVYGYYVEFSDSSPKKILGKINKLEDGCRVNLGLWDLEQPDDEEQE